MNKKTKVNKTSDKVYLFYFFFLVEYVLKEDDEKPEDETISNILLWAIFANRKELAEICWLRVENHLCTCNNIYKGNIHYLIITTRLILNAFITV